MSDSFVALNCNNCGSKLEVYGDMERFSCSYCGTEMIVQRRGGTIALKTVEAAIRKVQMGTDRTAAELAIHRLRNELATLTQAARAIEEEKIQVTQTAGGGAMVLFGSIVVILTGVLGIGFSVTLMDKPTFVFFGITVCLTGCVLLGVFFSRKSSQIGRRERAQSIEEARAQEENKQNRLSPLRRQIAWVQTQLVENFKILNG